MLKSGAKVRQLAATALTGAVFSAAPAQAADLANAQDIATFQYPTFVTTPPGEQHLLFVVEQAGQIQVLQDEVTQSRPFLNISKRVLTGAERGLFSMAFAPDYATSKLFYVAYTNKKGDVEIDEYKRMAGDARRADPGTRRVVLIVSHRDGTTHNGGQLQFGKDGYLYISIGDGGSLTFPKGAAARDLKKLLGKILRIDPKRKGSKSYTVPADNPYVGDPNKLSEIYAYGLRNPWRFSFDGGNMMIADEGEDAQEEINILKTRQVEGTNFGWPQFEGRLSHGGPPGPDTPKKPMYVYDHDSTHCAVVGGYVARDPDIPGLAGRYLFADLCGGKIMSMIPDVTNQKATSVKPVGPTLPRITSFGIGPKKTIYLVQGAENGKLTRLIPVP